jgi:HlyD family secretion protein
MCSFGTIIVKLWKIAQSETFMSVRRSLFLLTVLVILAPFVVYLRSQRTTNNQTSTQLDSLQLYRVGTGRVELSVSAIGTLDADQQTNLSFLTAGRIREVLVQRDDYVLAGDVLVRLDDTTARLVYEQAQLNVELAELAMQDLLTVDENQIKIAEASVTAAQGALYSITSAVQPADIEAAQLAYDQAKKNYDEAVIKRDTAQPGQYDILAAQAGEASFNMEIARLQLESLQTNTQPQAGAAYARVLQAQQELERIKAGPSQIQIDTTQAQIDRAELQLQQAKDAYDRTVLVAPYDGVVGVLNAEIGAIVAPSVTIVQMVDLSPLKLTVQVDEIDIRLIQVGLPVRVRLDALSDVSFSAQVIRIADSGNTTGGIVTYDVEIALNGDDSRARVGMTADATVVIQERDNTLFVPNLYIRIDRFTNEAFLNILRDDNSVDEVPITLGLQGQDVSEVTSGLQDGDLVVIDLGGNGLNNFLGGN